MAKIRVRQEDQFPHGLYLLRVSAAEDFEKVKAARAAGLDPKGQDVQARDRDTGYRLWHVEVFNPAGERGDRDLRVKVPAEAQPVPPVAWMERVEFDAIDLTPWVNEKGRSELSYRAAGFRQPVKSVKQS